ncbi:MAG: hypothetical protein C9356_04660 [Oleiphilus sp.]|nr:MAG: hypothetical protein C9356_04660 [Oleiphilus sp.]
MWTNSAAFLDRLLTEQRPEKPVTIGKWFRDFKAQVPSHFSSIERAALGGRRARCVGHAFTAGYQSALEHLFAAHFDPGSPALASFCVSETKGNHPRAIETCLSQAEATFILSGDKTFVSGAHEAQQLFVACREHSNEQQRPNIKVVVVSARAPGVKIESLPTLPFIPEVSHGRVNFDQVELDPVNLLAGDGYSEYIKPFRTCEDLHVMASVLAYVLGEIISEHLPKSLAEDALGALAGFMSLSHIDLKHPGSHLALAGLRRQLNAVLQRFKAELASCNTALLSDWERDSALLKVAGKAHEARTKKAWEAYLSSQALSE